MAPARCLNDLKENIYEPVRTSTPTTDNKSNAINKATRLNDKLMVTVKGWLMEFPDYFPTDLGISSMSGLGVGIVPTPTNCDKQQR